MCLSIDNLLLMWLSICNLSEYNENPLKMQGDQTNLGFVRETSINLSLSLSLSLYLYLCVWVCLN